MINFPKSEHKNLINRLNKNKPIYTTRVSKEKGKYKENEIYQSQWGDLLEIIDVKTFKDIKNHPFYNELTKPQIKVISNYDGFDLVKLRRVDKNGP